jgi:hypothetical protein
MPGTEIFARSRFYQVIKQASFRPIAGNSITGCIDRKSFFQRLGMWQQDAPNESVVILDGPHLVLYFKGIPRVTFHNSL